MNLQHKELAAGRWLELTFIEQMANIGSEVERAILLKNKEYGFNALERALELLDLTINDGRNGRRLRELTRLRETLADYFYSDNRYGSSDELWRNYFYAFCYAARKDR